jgi:hypothetical protein
MSGKVQVEKDDVVIVELAEVDALFAEIRRVNIEILGLEHQFDALRCRAVVFDEKYAHSYPLYRRRKVVWPLRDTEMSLRDLEAATKWLTNSDSLWQEVTNLLNNLSISLFSNENPQSRLLNFYIKNDW